MCGIFGVININKSAKPIKEKMIHDVRTAINVQHHRGPDDQGICAFCFEDRKSYSAMDALELNPECHMDGIIGFNRLSIKDLSMAGHQPMTAVEGKVILAFNGEIYNDAELRKHLIGKGHSFKSTTDTEVIMNLYLEYGFNEMVKRLNGMFAIVVIDLRNGYIFMTRDRFGIKPLYYTFYNGRLAFASEMKSIIQLSDFERKVDMNAFNARLVFARPSNHVLLSGVSILDPGQAASISCNGDKHFWKFFNLDAYKRNEAKYKNIGEAMEAAEEILSDAVARQVVSDVKVGCQLSGGIDSSLVSYYANKMAGRHLNDAVSIIDKEGVIGEERYIDHVGNCLGLDVHKFTLEPDYFLKNYERMIYHNDAPVYKPFFVCFLRLAERAKEYVTVLLSGEGSDEIAGGYSRFAAGVYQPFISKMGMVGDIKSYDSYARYAVMTDTTITSMLSNDWQNADELIQEQMDLFNNFSGSNFTKHLKFEITQRLPEALLRQDKMTMANSIENRVPLLDNKVVDFIMRLPEDMLIRFIAPSPLQLPKNPFEWVSGKFIFKELCAKKFGYDFAYRKKMIMALDERTMLTSSGFKEYFYDSIYPKMKSRGLINASQVCSLFENANDINQSAFTSMWRAISLETWCQLFLDKQKLAF